jgi:hypothetical protein
LVPAMHKPRRTRGAAIYRTKRRFVLGNLEAALSEEPRPGACRKLSGKEEATRPRDRRVEQAGGIPVIIADSVGRIGEITGPNAKWGVLRGSETGAPLWYPPLAPGGSHRRMIALPNNPMCDQNHRIAGLDGINHPPSFLIQLPTKCPACLAGHFLLFESQSIRWCASLACSFTPTRCYKSHRSATERDGEPPKRKCTPVRGDGLGCYAKGERSRQHLRRGNFRLR